MTGLLTVAMGDPTATLARFQRGDATMAVALANIVGGEWWRLLCVLGQAWLAEGGAGLMPRRYQLQAHRALVPLPPQLPWGQSRG